MTLILIYFIKFRMSYFTISFKVLVQLVGYVDSFSKVIISLMINIIYCKLAKMILTINVELIDLRELIPHER